VPRRQPLSDRQLNHNDAGAASRLISVGQQVGGSIGLAVIGTVAWSAVASNLRSQAVSGAKALHVSQTEVYHHALATGFSKGFLVSAGILVLMLIISLAMIRVRRVDLSGAEPEQAA
jgi:hypothetical protein